MSFDSIIYDSNERVRVVRGQISTPKWKDKQEVSAFGLSCYNSKGCWVRTIGITVKTPEVTFFGMQLPISIQYGSMVLICLDELITRPVFLGIQAKLQARIGTDGIVLKTQDMVRYPWRVDYVGGRIPLDDVIACL